MITEQKLSDLLTLLTEQWKKKQIETEEMRILLRGALEAVEVIKTEAAKISAESAEIK